MTCMVISLSTDSDKNNESVKNAVTMCPAPEQITVILCVWRAATPQPGRIAANLFVRRPEK